MRTTTNIGIHCFDTHGAAYDASQCDDDIIHGDVLVVRSPDDGQVASVALLIKAWPTLVDGTDGSGIGEYGPDERVFHHPVDTDWAIADGTHCEGLRVAQRIFEAARISPAGSLLVCPKCGGAYTVNLSECPDCKR